MEIVLLLATLTLLVLMCTFLSLTAEDRALNRDHAEPFAKAYVYSGHD